jgi:transposase
VIVLSAEEEQTLRKWIRSSTTEQRKVERARIILSCHRGLSSEEIAWELETRPARVSKWRQRFAKKRLEGLERVEPERPVPYPLSEPSQSRCR